MTSENRSPLSIVLCIAFLITMLPLLGGAVPAAARGASIKTVTAGDTIFVYETGLDLTALDITGGTGLLSLTKFVNDDTAQARIREIPVLNAADFDVLTTQVGSDYGKYYATNVTGAVPGMFVQIARPEATLGVVLAASHASSVDGKSISPDTSIAFRIASPRVGTSYVTAAGVAEGQLAVEITTPSGTKVGQLGGMSLSPINVSGTEQFTGAIPLTGAAPGTYTAVAKWITPDWKYQAPNSNSVTFTVLPGSAAMVTFSGQVTNTAGKALPGIWVYFWRQDGKKSFYVVTGTDGKYSAQVEKSKLLTQRYNIAANKDNADPDHPNNFQYATVEITNVAPTMNRAGLNFRLASGLVHLGGRVTDYYGKPLADIWVYFWRQDGKDAGYVKTNATGFYTRQVTRYPSTDKLHRYNIAANKDNGDPIHPKNPSFGTKEMMNIVPDKNRLALNFKLAPSR